VWCSRTRRCGRAPRETNVSERGALNSVEGGQLSAATEHLDGYAEHVRHELFLRCRGLAAWQNPDKEKKLVKKVYSPPRSFLAAVEAKSTLGARRNRGTCTLEQDVKMICTQLQIMEAFPPLASSLYAG
jgi:hypothetical protein